MALFIEGDQLNTALTDMILNADNYLWFISPYIKLNDRIKFNLNTLKEKPGVQIVIVFGKNEGDLSKSVSLQDLEFFADFPNVRLLHVKNLHAKYYGSEDSAIITSMNLYEFSQVNNLEAGLQIAPKNALKKLANLASPAALFDDAFENARNFFDQVIMQAQVLYHRRPEYKSVMLGLSEKYNGSETVINNVDKYFKQQINQAEKSKHSYSEAKPLSDSYANTSKGGYCIRTGVPIPFNIARPFSYEAYKRWAEYSNWDFTEKFCHNTGALSNGRTSMRNPILKNS